LYDVKPTKVTWAKHKTNTTILDTLQKLNINHSPTFLIPTKFISSESALVGQLLNNLCNSFTQKKTERKTFFCNSRYEALQGIVKIFRHHTKKPKNQPILIYDPSEVFQDFLAPKYTNNKVLQPGLYFSSTLENEELDYSKIQGLICYITQDSSIQVVSNICFEAKKHGIFTAIGFANDFNFLQNPKIYLSTPPDSYFFGENLTDHQVPFGAFCMTNGCYKPWDNINNCLIHSSTYGGNILALSYILKKFESSPLLGSKSKLQRRRDTVTLFKKHINPHAAMIYETLHLSPPVKSAHGSLLEIEWSKEEITINYDCLGNSGCSLRGHSPSDIIDNIILQHNPDHDYTRALEKKLFQLTNLPHLFTAPSGAAAVEIALQLVLMSTKYHQILTFSQNYAGKTLGALPLNGYEGYKLPFEPLYQDVIFFDPFQPLALEHLQQTFIENQIGLVWFEILQGDTLNEIPRAIIEYLKHLQAQKQVLVGIDEILTGCFRTGQFLISEYYNLQPDIVTLSKGLSDMTFPFACVLASKSIFDHAKKTAPDSVRLFSSEFVNSLGAHIAISALQQAEKQHLSANAKQAGSLIQKKLGTLFQKNGMISEVKGRGLLLYLAPNPKLLIVKVFGVDIFGFILSSYLIRKYKIFLFNCRITPALSISQSETDSIIEQLSRGLHQLSQAKMWGMALYSFGKIYAQSIWHKALGLFKR